MASSLSLLNCCTCGQFVGKDGNPDVYYDEYNGGYEAGYPTCGKCLFEGTPEAKKEISSFLKNLSISQKNCLLEMLGRLSINGDQGRDHFDETRELQAGTNTLYALENRHLITHEFGRLYPTDESYTDKWKLTKKGIYIAKKLQKPEA